MAIQTSIHTFINKIGNLRGFKRIYDKKNKNFESLKGGMSKYTFLNNPSTQGTRNNVNEFKEAVHNSTLIYNYLKNAAYLNNTNYYRFLTKAFVDIIHSSTGAIGQRPFTLSSYNNIIKNIPCRNYAFKELFLGEFTITPNGSKNLIELTINPYTAAALPNMNQYDWAKFGFIVISKNNRSYDTVTNLYKDDGNIGDLAMNSIVFGAEFKCNHSNAISQLLQGGDISLFPDSNVSILCFTGLMFGNMYNGYFYPSFRNTYFELMEIL